MFQWLYQIAQTYPESIAIAAGLGATISTAQILKSLWFPAYWTMRDNWRVMVIIDFLMSFALTHILWHFLDKDKDSFGLITAGSLAVAFMAPAIHFIIIKTVAKKWPWLDSGAEMPIGVPTAPGSQTTGTNAVNMLSQKMTMSATTGTGLLNKIYNWFGSFNTMIQSSNFGYFMAHSLASVVLLTINKNWPFHLRLLIALLWFVIFSLKEYWYDLSFEKNPPQTWGDSTKDWMGYMVGTIVALVYAGIMY